MTHLRSGSDWRRRLGSLSVARHALAVAAAAAAAAVHIATGGTADTAAIGWLLALA
ncbi:hypothetical protein [Ideonella sp. YS5]|uniref:hypothetical protein n=1 Tax=Ideonella sp. YS5 TaxID=3453714 RepID=UPI003EE833D8